VCQKYTKAYIHHLFKAHELLGYRLLTLHNLALYADLMGKIRNAIDEGSLQRLKLQWLGNK
jgi:tRNA-guanine family transglycosylase